MPSRQKLMQMLLEAQERLCGLCWCPLRNNIDTDHILPKAWHTKLGKPGKNRKDNLQATHVNCNKKKGSYPSPWHRHTLKMCLALARGSTLNVEPFLKKQAGPGPAFQDRALLQGPEQMHFRTAYGLTVPCICEYFSDQGLPVPARTRSDRFLQPFLEWLNTEPVQARIQSERADIYAEAPEMWNRAAAHVNRASPEPCVSVPVDRFRELLADEAVLGGVMAYGIPGVRLRGTPRNPAGVHSRRMALAAPTTQARTSQQVQQAASSGLLTVEMVARSCDTPKMLL